MANNRFTAKAVRDGAMMTALSVIFMLAGIYVPFFSMLGMLLSGVPLAVLYFKDGLAPSVYAAIISSVIVFIFTWNILNAFLMMLAYGIPGLVSGICLKKNLQLYYSVAFVGLAFLFGFLCELLSVKLFMGGIENMFNQVFDLTEKNLKPMLEGLAEKSGDGDTAQAVKTIMDAVKNTFRLYFPSMTVIVSLISGYAIYCLSGYLLKRLRIYKGNITPFRMIRAPKSLCNVSAALLIVSFFIKKETMFSASLLNIVFILYFLIGIAGFSFIDYKLSFRIEKGYIRALLYAAVFIFGAWLMSWVIIACVLLGFVDSTMNFRNIDVFGEDAGENGHRDL